MDKCKRSGYNTDVFMGRLYASLVSDLTSNAGLEDLRYRAVGDVVKRCESTGDYSALRQLILSMPEPNFSGSVYNFKTVYQLKHYLKRYIFRTDLYTSDYLEETTNTTFLKLQEDLSRPRKAYKQSTEMVLRRARLIVKEVLGPYDYEEHVRSCRFSTKACVGFPTTRSYLHTKACGPLTGSYEHIRWFQTIRSQDNILDEAFSKECHVVDTLNLINVPKSYKTLRGITPNTLIGSYHSYGLGVMMQKRLMKVGIDITKQPSLHQKIAKRESQQQKLVTADLSNASNCFTSVLVRKLVPREWYRHINCGRLSNVSIDDRSYYMASFMAMGIGFTFPLQTLLFYAIIRACQELTGKRGFISVFGDDLIYHRRVHPYVVSVLSDCGFSLNKDKTFVSVPFRESCGGDFFRSVDVRPANPEGVGSVLGKWKYLSFLHKIVNGLTLRWTEYEIASSLHLVKRELLRIGGSIFAIPDDLPDYAGVKRLSWNWYEPTYRPVYQNQTQCYMFTCLVESPAHVPVPTLIAYYWDSLRSACVVEEGRSIRGCFGEPPKASVWAVVRDHFLYKPAPIGSRPKNYRSRITRRRLTLLQPFTTEKGGRASILRVHQAISILAS